LASQRTKKTPIAKIARGSLPKLLRPEVPSRGIASGHPHLPHSLRMQIQWPLALQSNRTSPGPGKFSAPHSAMAASQAPGICDRKKFLLCRAGRSVHGVRSAQSSQSNRRSAASRPSSHLEYDRPPSTGVMVLLAAGAPNITAGYPYVPQSGRGPGAPGAAGDSLAALIQTTTNFAECIG